MRIGVLETDQPHTEVPTRHISKARAQRFILRRIAKWIVAGRLMQMLKEADVIRGDAEYLRVRAEIVPVKRKRWDRNLLIYYPHRSQESQRPGRNLVRIVQA